MNIYSRVIYLLKETKFIQLHQKVLFSKTIVGSIEYYPSISHWFEQAPKADGGVRSNLFHP